MFFDASVNSERHLSFGPVNQSFCRMGERHNFSDSLFQELSFSFDKILDECNNLLNNNIESTDPDAMQNGKSTSSTVPCGICGRRFLPERIVSLLYLAQHY